MQKEITNLIWLNTILPSGGFKIDPDPPETHSSDFHGFLSFWKLFILRGSWNSQQIVAFI